jgi:hypothetical protein
MEDTLLSILLTALAVTAVGSALFHWARRLARKRVARLRTESYRFIHALKAYSAWIECQRDLPFTARSLDEMTSPEPLDQARAIKRDWFPDLHPQIVRLMRAHHRMIEYLWQQSLLRLSQGSGWCPASEDPVYQQLRSEQEDLIDEMIGACRQITGDADRDWQRTGSDFNFSNNFRISGEPVNRA